MILINGAAGKTGRAVIRALVNRGARVRGLVRRPEQVQALIDLGAAEVLVGDMRQPASMDQACAGAQAVYHITPNVHPDEVAVAQTAIQAAGRNGVEHFVYHSVLHPQTEAMPHHWLKMRVEEKLFESGLPFTILQPCAYMQNVLAQWDQILTHGVYPVPYALDARLGMVDLQDVAEAAAEVLTQKGHLGAIYELSGPEALTQTEVAETLSRVLDREVRAEVLPREIWEQCARQSGLGDYPVETLKKMFRYYESYGLWGSPQVLSWLLGRTPTTFSAFLERMVKERSS